MALGPPLNPLSRNVGNGVLEVQWDAPAVGTPDTYEVWIATALAGPYVKANTEEVSATWYRVRNLPFGNTIYTKVRALDSAGVAGDWSAVAQDATCSKAVTILRFTGPLGDVIPKGAMFAALVGGTLVAVKTLDGRTVS